MGYNLYMIGKELSMTFSKQSFQYHGGYLTYGSDRKFVARFKHRGPVGKADFIRLLSKYYTPEVWFERAKTLAPMQILMNDGLVKFDSDNRRFLVAK
jgi:hypothetical protein